MKFGLIIASGLVFTSLTAIAGGPEPIIPPPCYVGPYIGGGAGTEIGFFNIDSNTGIDTASPLGTFTFSNRSHVSNQAVLGTLTLGWGFRFFNNFYFGPELWGNAANIEGSTHNISNNLIPPAPGVSISTGNRIRLSDFSGGIDGRFGYVWNQSHLIYGRAGAAFSSLKLFTTSKISEVDYSLGSKTKSVTGWRAGGGLEECISIDWSIRGDYIFTHYGSISKDSRIAPSVATISNRTKARVNSHIISLSVLYHISLF